MKFQRKLQLDQPFMKFEAPGTHNSAISQAYGFGIEQDGIEALLSIDMYKYVNVWCRGCGQGGCFDIFKGGVWCCWSDRLFLSHLFRGDDEGEGVCQYLSITDQLRIGLRHIGNTPSSVLFALLFTGCSPFEPTLYANCVMGWTDLWYNDSFLSSLQACAICHSWKIIAMFVGFVFIVVGIMF